MTDPASSSPVRAVLFARLDALGIAHRTVEHPAFFTVEEGREHKKEMPGGHTKNLFVKDKAGALTLAIAWADTRVDLVGLGKRLGAKGRLSFGKPELLQETLGVTPGSVTAFALMNAADGQVAHVIVDAALMEHDPVWCHPMENTASTAVSAADLLAFIRACGFEPQVLDLAAPHA